MTDRDITSTPEIRSTPTPTSSSFSFRGFRPKKSHIKYAIVSAVALFCFANIYRSTTADDFNSSHEYHGRIVIVEGDQDDPSDGPSSSNSSSSSSGRWKKREDRARMSADDRLVKRLQIPALDDYPPYDKSVDGTSIPVPLWQRRVAAGSRRETGNGTSGEEEEEEEGVEGEDGVRRRRVYYFLAELLQVRIYGEDKARWTVNELKQWMHYMFLAGVQHIYVCDHFARDYERLERALERYTRLGLVTYVPWGGIRDPMTAQIKCYQRIINRYKHEHLWQIAVDMDEYPFAPNDTREDFLVRYLRGVPNRVSEVSLANYLMLGRGDRSGQTVIERINRMTRDTNGLDKPIYRPQRVRANIHHNHLLTGDHVNADPARLTMLHYWGARSQAWGPDTPKTIAMTTEMNRMREAWAERVRNSLIVFGESDAITNSTGI